jgi:release factor glutamine methyltransferase
MMVHCECRPVDGLFERTSPKIFYEGFLCTVLLPSENTIRSVKKLITEALSPLYSATEAASIASIYLDDRFSIDRTQQLLNERRITESEINILNDDLTRLINGEPIQYVTGKATFCGLDFSVDGAVLIPRQETEELIAAILADYGTDEITLLDIGTGSGCIPIALKAERPFWNVSAMEISENALSIAKQNAASNSTEINFYLADVFEENAEFKELDIIVSNPPYVGRHEAKEIHRNVLVFEPHLALFPESDDGLIFYRRIGELGRKWLKKEGELYFDRYSWKG